jgi:DNA-binding PadR family transcriptional regulator
VQAIQVQSNGALKSRRREVGGRSRVYYSATSRGVRRLSDLTDTWMATTQAIQSVLKGGLHVRTI